jgi:hypothetical protein
MCSIGQRGVFLLAGGAVGASAGAKFDLSAVEVLLELVPFLVRRVAVFNLGPNLAAAVQMLLAVAYDVLVEDRVTAGGLDVEAAQQSPSDVARQAAVAQLGGEDSTEIARGELQPAETVVNLGESQAPPTDHLVDGSGAEDSRCRAVLPLDEERHGSTPLFVVWVVPADERDRTARAGVPANDRSDDVEEFGGHRNHAFTVGLRRSDHQQRADLTICPLVLPNAQMGELDELIHPHSGVPQCLHRGSLAEGGLFLGSDVDELSAGLLDDAVHAW